MDVCTVFIHDGMDQSILYMNLPKCYGLNIPEGKSLLLRKGLSSFKNAPKQWNQKCKGDVQEMGVPLQAFDQCLSVNISLDFNLRG